MKTLRLFALAAMASLAAHSAFAEPPAADATPQEKHGGKMFGENDTNKDGAIDKGKWTAKGDKMFAEIDRSKDGKISPDEMKAHHQKKRGEWKERRENMKEKVEARKEKIEDRKEKRKEHLDSKPASPETTH